MPNFKDYDQNQTVFRQLAPNELLEDCHPARIVDMVVEKLDLKKIYAAYKDEGKPAYHPKMMMKVLFYSYQTGLMSSRKMENGLQYRADFIFLSGDQVPDFRTLNAFRTRHMKELPDLFAQIVMLCSALGMVDFKHLAVDGQKIQACASFRNTVDIRRAHRRRERAAAGLKKLLEQEPDSVVSKEIIEKRQKELARKQAKLEKAIQFLSQDGNESKSVNMVDGEAVIMSHKDRQILPSYNHQSAVDGTFGISCAVATTQSGDAPADLLPLVDAACQNADKPFENVLADCGFCDFATLQEMETAREETFHVPDRIYATKKDNEDQDRNLKKDDFTFEDNGTKATCPQGQVMSLAQEKVFPDGHIERTFLLTKCGACPLRDRCTKDKNGRRRVTYDSRQLFRDSMRERLDSPQGRETYMKRQGIVEPIHGQDQKNIGWRQHHLRGLEKAAGEFLLISLARNIGKIARYKAKELLSIQAGLTPCWG